MSAKRERPLKTDYNPNRKTEEHHRNLLGYDPGSARVSEVFRQETGIVFSHEDYTLVISTMNEIITERIVAGEVFVAPEGMGRFFVGKQTGRGALSYNNFDPTTRTRKKKVIFNDQTQGFIFSLQWQRHRGKPFANRSFYYLKPTNDFKKKLKKNLSNGHMPYRSDYSIDSEQQIRRRSQSQYKKHIEEVKRQALERIDILKSVYGL